MSDIKKGDKVEILIGGEDPARYGMTTEMAQSKGKVVEVSVARRSIVQVVLPGRSFQPCYSPDELKKVEPERKFKKGDRVKIVGKEVTLAVVDDPASEHIQSHDELAAENESLEKQIRKLEERVERKKEFWRQNRRKIAAWQVILEK